MKNLLLLILFNSIITINSSAQSLASVVYQLDETITIEKDFGSISNIASGATRDFRKMSISLFSISLNKQIELPGSKEKLIIIKSGKASVSSHEETQSLGQGSVVVAAENDKIILQNKDQEPLEFYVFQYETTSITEKSVFTSLIINWDDIEFKPHDKGGIRNFFDMKTNECRTFEMHVTNLNAGIKSHEPHTHRAGEFILIIKGYTEMEIDGKGYLANAGDLYFVDSEVAHAIKNIGSGQCQYFAFQME